VLVRDALLTATKRLTGAGIDDARIEAEVLLQHALHCSKTQLYATLADPMPQEAGAALEAYVSRRLRREPSAYITGHKEYYGLDLEVTPATLIPRPETELIVEAVLEDAQSRPNIARPLRIADAGTGSGAIALAIACYLPQDEVIATDMSAAALAVARRNAERLGVARRVSFVCCDLLEGIQRQSLDIVAANLPYVGSEDAATLAPEILEYEPHDALFGGPGGLEPIERLLASAGPHLRPGATLVLEFGYGQAGDVVNLLQHYFPGAEIEVRRDLAGIERVVVARMRNVPSGG
jgi:release factor glutamine methyltransferase